MLAAAAAAALAPALLTEDTLKPLRAVGLIVPLALLIGRGASWIGRRRWGALAGAFLITWAGFNTARDFAAWVRSPDLFLPMEQHVYRGIENLAQIAPPDVPIYVSPFSPDHPVVRLRQWRLAPHPVGTFDASECVRLTSVPQAHYFALTVFDRGFANRFDGLARIETVYTEPDAARFAVYSVSAEPEVLRMANAVTFDGRLSVELAAAPSQAQPSDVLPLTALLRAQTALDRPYTLFVHLYGDPTPYEGGTLWAQSDIPICRSGPPSTWRIDEMIALPLVLILPADLPPGRYAIALGVYETASGQRLPVSAPQPGSDYAVVQPITVQPPA